MQAQQIQIAVDAVRLVNQRGGRRRAQRRGMALGPVMVGAEIKMNRSLVGGS